MKIFEKLNYNPNLSVALGFFDGVHIAHQKLIKKAVELAHENNIKSAVITFKNNPLCELKNIEATNLYLNEEKFELIEGLGVDFLYVLDFKDYINLSAEEYLKDVLYKNFEPKFIITGFNHTFGKNKIGNTKFLKENEEKFGYNYIEIPPEKINSTLVSTSNIKKNLAEGNIEFANTMLGRKFKISNTVLIGEQLGRTLGFPTANIAWQEKIFKLPFGVYSGECEIDKKYKTIVNFGLRPTVGCKKEIVEAYIIDFNGNLYNKNITIYFDKKIRDEKKFNNIDDLKHQIQKDVELFLG